MSCESHTAVEALSGQGEADLSGWPTDLSFLPDPFLRGGEQFNNVNNRNLMGVCFIKHE